MRELNQQEIEHVSGAGFIADATATLGYGIGSVIDMGLKLAGVNVAKQPSEATQTLGRGIGMVVESSLSIVTSLFSSVYNSVFKRN